MSALHDLMTRGMAVTAARRRLPGPVVFPAEPSAPPTGREVPRF